MTVDTTTDAEVVPLAFGLTAIVYTAADVEALGPVLNGTPDTIDKDPSHRRSRRARAWADDPAAPTIQRLGASGHNGAT
jgi:hypothetical protein